MKSQLCAVYILTNATNRVLYTGVTHDLPRRLTQHRRGALPASFVTRYKVYKLVYYELTPNIESAIRREKQIKAGSRSKKIAMIEAMNPHWNDLAEGEEPR
jgi:putative endonuclease